MWPKEKKQNHTAQNLKKKKKRERESERRGENNSEKTQENMVTQKPCKQSISRSDQL